MTATITVQGGLTAQPELRYSQNGMPITSGTIASTDRYLDRKTNEWTDGKKLYLRWSAFKDLAEHIAASNLDRGSQVTITGKLHTREWEDRDGQKRSSTELEVIDFAVSLKRATVQVQRVESGQRQQPADDSWATPQANTWSQDDSADTPF